MSAPKEYPEREIFAYGRYIQCQILNWSEGPPPQFIICNPLDARYREEFIAHQAMGTWAQCDLRHVLSALASTQAEILRLTEERDEARASWKQAVDLYEMEVARVDPALAEIARLKAALAPFAIKLNEGYREVDDAEPFRSYFSVGDIRRAALSLSRDGGEEKP